jgi:GntR family transcriptional regulator/MocR family aminotransferase
MRKLYPARRQCLLEAIHGRFGDALPVSGDNAGLHLVLEPAPGTRPAPLAAP